MDFYLSGKGWFIDSVPCEECADTFGDMDYQGCSHCHGTGSSPNSDMTIDDTDLKKHFLNARDVHFDLPGIRGSGKGYMQQAIEQGLRIFVSRSEFSNISQELQQLLVLTKEEELRKLQEWISLGGKA